jgi:hypothetical protein
LPSFPVNALKDSLSNSFIEAPRQTHGVRELKTVLLCRGRRYGNTAARQNVICFCFREP